MKRIAADEARHASLAWSVAEWAETRLSSVSRRRVRAAYERAREELLRELAAEPSGEIARVLGVPRACQARALAAKLGDALA
jgi:hypothetical protein